MTGREFFEKHNESVIKYTYPPSNSVLEWKIVGYCDGGDFNECIVVQLLSGDLNDLRSRYDILMDSGHIISGLSTQCCACYAFMSQNTILELMQNAKQAIAILKHSRRRHKFSPIKFR